MKKATIRQVIAGALEDSGIAPDVARSAARKVITRLCGDRDAVADLATETHVFRRVGFTNRQKPKTISPIAVTRHHVPSYIADNATAEGE